MHNPISSHPLLLALAEQYAKEIKALRKEEYTQIGSIYSEFRIKYALVEEILKAESESRPASSPLASDRHPSCS